VSSSSPPPSRGLSWRDHLDAAVEVPALPGPQEKAFYLPIGAFQGEAYARNAFTAGTEEEAAVLVELLELRRGAQVLDVGCGDGRHLRRLAHETVLGVRGTGIDVAPALVAAGRAAAERDGVEVTFEVADARQLPAWLGPRAGRFDAAWSLCQGALGTSPETDPEVVAGLAAAVRPGGLVAYTCFHALFAARHLAPGDAFDTVGLVHHQVSEVHGPDHARQRFDLWTAAYTAREAVQLAVNAGLHPVSVRGVEPGAYGRRAPGEVALDDPEVLVVAQR